MSDPILIVENDEAKSRLLTYLLKEKMGYEVVHVRAVVGALRELQARKFSLAITNITVQRDRDGLKLLQMLLLEHKLKQIPPLVVATEDKEPAVIKQCAQAGIADYIVYPFADDVFVQRIAKVADKPQSLGEKIVHIAAAFLGPATRMFLEKQTKSKMNNLELDEVKDDHLPELFRWIHVSCRPILKERVAELLHRLEQTFNVKRKGE